MSTEEEAAAKAAAEAAAKPVTMAELKVLLGEKDLSTTVHAAAATHAKRTEEKLAKALAAAREEDAKAFELKLSEFQKLMQPAPPKTADGQPSAGAQGAGPAFKLEESPEFQSFKKQADEQKKELDRLHKKHAEAAAKEAEATAKARKQNLRSTLDELLAKHVVPGRAGHARAFLTHPDNNRIAYEADDSDVLVFITDDGDKMPLATGLQTWLKSEDAKHYLPPNNPGGSGSGPAGSRTRQPNDSLTPLRNSIKDYLGFP